MLRTALLAFALVLALALPVSQAAAEKDVTQDDAFAALWTDWKFALQHSKQVALQANMLSGPGKEYVLGWVDLDNPDTGPTFNLTVTYATADGPAYIMATFPVEGNGQNALCGQDVSLEAFPVDAAFAENFGLTAHGAEGVAIDDGMCDRIFVTARQGEQGPVLEISRN